MECAHDLYIEEHERFHGESEGDYVVMCSICAWADRFVYQQFDYAADRQEELKREHE